VFSRGNGPNQRTVESQRERSGGGRVKSFKTCIRGLAGGGEKRETSGEPVLRSKTETGQIFLDSHSSWYLPEVEVKGSEEKFGTEPEQNPWGKPTLTASAVGKTT